MVTTVFKCRHMLRHGNHVLQWTRQLLRFQFPVSIARSLLNKPPQNYWIHSRVYIIGTKYFYIYFIEIRNKTMVKPEACHDEYVHRKYLQSHFCLFVFKQLQSTFVSLWEESSATGGSPKKGSKTMKTFPYHGLTRMPTGYKQAA